MDFYDPGHLHFTTILSSDRIELSQEKTVLSKKKGLALFCHFLFELFREKSEFIILVENQIIFTVGLARLRPICMLCFLNFPLANNDNLF